MPVTRIVMVRQSIVAVRRHFVAISRCVDRQLDAEHAPARRLSGVRHASEAGKHQHQTGEQGEKLAHHLSLITPRPWRNRSFSVSALSAPEAVCQILEAFQHNQ